MSHIPYLSKREQNLRRYSKCFVLLRCASAQCYLYLVRMVKCCSLCNLFLLASGEMPESFFHTDKVHLKDLGTRHLLSNIDRVVRVTKKTPTLVKIGDPKVSVLIIMCISEEMTQHVKVYLSENFAIFARELDIVLLNAGTTEEALQGTR